ncbi:MAG: proteasome accessory factor PafA2 [Bifidobacteriaceae bacterium]|jgi:proteasome accessory factor A|nr:proteasome accessory factor PafA2 [Bifidobacteriaceae bacterium]
MSPIVFGIETEYGVLGPTRNPVELSNWVVAAYKAAQHGRVAPWDYRSEDPLNDARGFHLDRAAAHPSLLTDRPGAVVRDLAHDAAGPSPVERGGPGAALLANGARLYVDHAHPEYASPETMSAREAALWDLAGQRVMATAARSLAEAGKPVSLYKNNTDGQGASYGTHENYLVARTLDWDLLVQVMTPFLVTRQIYTGSGRVGLGQRSQEPGFQLSQRADFVEAEVGLETTLNRPIVNTRDEPHADPARWRRLHVIVGDATMMDVATYVRLGLTGLVLLAAEAAPDRAAALARSVRLASPVEAFKQVSRDLTVREKLETQAGGAATAVAIQRRYLDFVSAVVVFPDPEALDLLDRWGRLLDGLSEDPMSVGRQVEWVAKYQLLESLRLRGGLAWDHPKLRAADLKWTEVEPSRSLFARVAGRGAVETLFGERELSWAVAHPPTSTRAYLKGEALSRYPENVVAAGWDSLTLSWADGQTRFGLPSPLAGSRTQVQAVLAEAASAEDLAERLAGVDLEHLGGGASARVSESGSHGRIE